MASDLTSSDYSELQDEHARNKTNVKCCHCDSLILKPTNAEFVNTEFELPMEGCKEKDDTKETLRHFWEVTDIYTFENIGFTNTVNDKKYLICADCHKGPIGYFDLATKISYVALSRVKNE
ncbi:guanine nucleotide exchange factor MSS4 homolog [Anopheles nili]|uniref:guanine nucleotide exchange factor MSS4 homolog n=1 Tax=Anopheles nili TaxID=185578 RepID=UPI00237B82FD|nr:guanine nucleotide exchange factor MSS4 homolog [Anopheles nili]